MCVGLRGEFAYHQEHEYIGRQGFVVKNSRKIPQGSKLHSYEVMNDLINGEHPTKQQFDQRPKLSLLQFSNESLRLFWLCMMIIAILESVDHSITVDNYYDKSRVVSRIKNGNEVVLQREE